MQKVNVIAEVSEEEMEGMSRYTFTLNSVTGVAREFIVDVPHDQDDITDVWVLGHEVAVGDTPADGFATYTPKVSGS